MAAEYDGAAQKNEERNWGTVVRDRGCAQSRRCLEVRGHEGTGTAFNVANREATDGLDSH